MKKTYIPSTPRSRKLKSVGGGTINVSGGSAQNVPVIEGHTHDNKIILDAITQLHLRILSSLNVDEDGALIVELSNIIKELDATVPTDENLFSALRTVLEIRARSISKTDPDTAQEIIKFVKGIEIGTFTTGPLGAGAAIKMENGVSRMEVDQLDVRMRATFRELIIESLKHIGGQLILSPARMKCTSVVDGGTYYKCYFDTGDGKVSNEFVAGDQARCQVFTGSGVKMYWRLVTSVGTDWINLSKTDAISGSSIPEAGDDIVQLGNRSDVTRQNAQILSTVGADAPSWKQYKGINSFSLEGKDTTVFSGTGNKIDGKTVFMSSGANVEDGINSKNSNYSSQPTSYKANDTWTLSSDTTVNGIAYKSGEILTATQDSTAFVQAHWVKKVRYTDDTAVNNLQIGGRNYQRNIGIGYAVSNASVVASENKLSIDFDTTKGASPYVFLRVLDNLKSKSGEEITTQLKITNKNSEIVYLRYGVRSIAADVAIFSIPANSTKKITNTQKTTVDSDVNTKIIIYAPTSGNPSSVNIDIEEVGVHKGNKSADWTEAIEDTDAKIADTKLYVEYSTNGTSWHTTFQTNDIYMRQKTGVNGTWTGAIKIVGKDGTSVNIKGKVPTSASLPSSASLGDGYIAEDTGHLWVWTGSWTDAGQIQGDSGANSYIHIAYADDSLGGGFSHNPSGKSWIGIYADFTAIDSDTPSDYTWMYAKGQQGDQGVSITGVDVEFAKNTTPGSAPTTGWTTTAPTLLDGEQLWTRTKTTYSSGSPTYSTPANITPKTGATGQGIDSVTEEYHISSSKTTQPAEGSAGWSTTQPTWSQGQYIWSRVKVVYKNPASTVYTGYAVSSEWEAVNNLEIGGRNLLKNTNRRIEHSNYRMESFYLGDVKPQTGERVTIAFKGELSLNKTFWQLFVDGTVNQASDLTVSDKGADGVWRKTFTWNAGSSGNTYLNIYSAPGTQSGISWIEDVMLVFGNKIAYYSKAPEDVQAEITAAKQEALVASNTVQTNVNDLNTYVTGAFKDGLIDEAEAKAIEKYKNTINETMAKAEASFAKVFANTYLEGAAKTALENAKINLWGQRDTLLSTINTAIADGKTTIAEKNAVDSAFNTFNSLMSAFQNALEEANKTIQAKLDSLSKGYVNDLEIGARNWYRLFDDSVNSGIIWSTGGLFTEANSLTSGYINVSKTDIIICNFDINQIAVYDGNKNWIGNLLNNFTITTSNGSILFTAKQVIKFPDDDNIAFIRVAFRNNFLTTNSPESVIINKGNKLTGWMQSPEDVQAAIDAEKNRVNDIISDNVADPSEKQYLSNLWQEIYAEYPRIWAQANTYAVDKTNYEAKYSALNTLLSPVLANLTVNTTVSGASIRTAFSQYYDARIFLQNAITNKVNQNAGDAAAVAADAQAKANVSKAVTDTFKTTINGGLISTVMILLRELNSIIETAGISGIQDDGYLPAYWSGGTYAEALAFGELMRAVDRGDNPIASATLNAKMSSIVMLHNGHAKVGELIIKSNGQIIILDKATGKIKFIINSQDIPSVAELMGGTAFGETKNNSSVLGISTDTTLSETISVTKNNSNITFTATSLSLSSVLDDSRCTVSLKLYKDGAYYNDIANVTISGSGAMSDSLSNISRTFTGCPIGTYSVRIMFSQSGLVLDKSASLSASVLKWDFTQSGVRYFQLGLNGLMAFYSDNHFHYTETGGLDVRGATNMPGILISGSVASGGGFSSSWGAKKHATLTAQKTATGTYTVYHSVGHSDYSVQITPETDQRVYYVPSANKGTSSFIVYFRNLAGTLSDSAFSFSINGKNYA